MKLFNWKGNKRKSISHRSDMFVICGESGKYVVGLGEDGNLNYYGEYDEKNDKHRILKKLYIGEESQN